jgi:hypothetical protein
MKIENQLDPQYKGWYLGKVKTSSFANYGCHLFCWTFMYSIKEGRQISPKVVDGIFVKAGVYIGDMIVSEKAAQALGLQYLGKEYDVNKAPSWYPNIKQVDYSIAKGAQTHFVIRDSINGKRIIKDPLGGVIRPINFYENKVNNRLWNNPKGNFSYRLAKI